MIYGLHANCNIDMGLATKFATHHCRKGWLGVCKCGFQTELQYRWEEHSCSIKKATRKEITINAPDSYIMRASFPYTGRSLPTLLGRKADVVIIDDVVDDKWVDRMTKKALKDKQKIFEKYKQIFKGWNINVPEQKVEHVRFDERDFFFKVNERLQRDGYPQIKKSRFRHAQGNYTICEIVTEGVFKVAEHEKDKVEWTGIHAIGVSRCSKEDRKVWSSARGKILAAQRAVQELKKLYKQKYKPQVMEHILHG